jgi:hypothetical protein
MGHGNDSHWEFIPALAVASWGMWFIFKSLKTDISLTSTRLGATGLLLHWVSLCIAAKDMKLLLPWNWSLGDLIWGSQNWLIAIGLCDIYLLYSTWKLSRFPTVQTQTEALPLSSQRLAGLGESSDFE